METARALMRPGGINVTYNPKARSLLEDLYGHPSRDKMSPFERVQAAVERRQSDRVPFDFWAVPEVINALQVYLGAENEEQIMQLLGVDCRVIAPNYIGPEPQRFADGSYFTPWGDHRKLASNPYSTYEEYASYPLSDVNSVDEVKSWANWPKSDYWDWQSVVKKIQNINSQVRFHIRYEAGGIFESAWALYGLEHFLTALVDQPEIPCAIMDAYTDLMIENIHRLIDAAHGWIDMVYTYDDMAIQTGLLMSPAMWRKYILPRHKRLNQVIKSYGLKILYHSCGGIAPLIGALVDEMGIDMLNPLQPRPNCMDMARIKADFGDRLAFHGGLDLQQTMNYGSAEEVQSEVLERIRILGAGGGYICTTAHYIQADTPIENILAMYTTSRAFFD